jgi:copper chaperone
MLNTEIKIPDMSCNHCVKRISDTLTKNGIIDFSIDLSNKTITIQKTQLPEALRLLDEIEYPGTVIK